MTAAVSFRRVEHVMGTAVSFDLRAVGDPAVVDAAAAHLRWVDATFSTYRADSEVGRMRSGDLPRARVSPDVRDVLAVCEDLRWSTDGCFDHEPSGPGSLDPSAYVKGWAIDHAAAIVAAAASDFSINAGGDVVAAGSPAPGGLWRVGIRHPAHEDQVAAVVTLAGGAVATSGAYERGSHVWGRAAGLASATVVGPSLGIADALATAVFACGRREPTWLEHFPQYGLVTIDSEYRVAAVPPARVEIPVDA